MGTGPLILGGNASSLSGIADWEGGLERGLKMKENFACRLQKGVFPDEVYVSEAYTATPEEILTLSLIMISYHVFAAKSCTIHTTW